MDDCRNPFRTLSGSAFMAFICAAHPARLSSRRRDGDNRVALIRHLQVRCVRRTLVDQAETGNTRISGRILSTRGACGTDNLIEMFKQPAYRINDRDA